MIEENSESLHTKMISEAISTDDLNQRMLDAYNLLQTKNPALQDPLLEDLVMTSVCSHSESIFKEFPKVLSCDYASYCSCMYNFAAGVLLMDL